MCEEVTDRDGPHRRVYTCSTCRKDRARDPSQYDLFDGVRTRALHGTSTSSVSESRAELRALAWRAIQRRMSGAEQSAMLALQKLCPVESDELSMISSFRQTR